jgi:hypothetical protein
MSSSSNIKGFAVRFLQASVRAGAKAGELLGPHVFEGAVPMRQHIDFPAAMEYAVGQGWVEKTGSDQYYLTKAGETAGTFISK